MQHAKTLKACDAAAMQPAAHHVPMAECGCLESKHLRGARVCRMVCRRVGRGELTDKAAPVVFIFAGLFAGEQVAYRITILPKASVDFRFGGIFLLEERLVGPNCPQGIHHLAKGAGEDNRIVFYNRRSQPAGHILIGKVPEVRQMPQPSMSMDEVGRSWEEFIGQMEELVCILAGSREETEGVAGLFALKAIDQWGNVTAYGRGEACYEDIEAAQKKAVENRRTVDRMEDGLLAKKEEYSKVMQQPGGWEES